MGVDIGGYRTIVAREAESPQRRGGAETIKYGGLAVRIEGSGRSGVEFFGSGGGGCRWVGRPWAIARTRF